MLQRRKLPDQYFGEGIVDWGPDIYQWTWQSHICFVYDRFSLRPVRQIGYTGEGWGMTRTARDIIISDGTATLRFRDPTTFKAKRHIVVRDGKIPVEQLNELEYVKGEIYANVWHSDRIARISPRDGHVIGWVDLTGLMPDSQRVSAEAVLNGIAYDALHNRLFVTGKQWSSATILPEETIVVEGRRYPCYVVHATAEGPNWHTEETFWIEKKTLMFRKKVEQDETFLLLNPVVKIPSHEDVTTLYPVLDLHPVIDPKLFAFIPPPDAKEVASLEPVLPLAQPTASKAVGKLLPDLSLAGEDGQQTKLSSFRGRPLLIDVWATWCGPCLEWMPSLGRLEKEMRDKGLQVISIDRDEAPETATHYLAVHGFRWPNYHDREGTLSKALEEPGIPLTVLVDATGRITYIGAGSDNEAALREAFAGLMADAQAGSGR